MKNIISLFQIVAFMLALFALLAGCGFGSGTPPTFTPTSPPPEFNLILDPDITDVIAGQSVTLAIEASGQGLRIKWSVIRGTLSALEGPAVVYTPPGTPGKDTVTVEVSTAVGTTIKNVSFNIIVSPTETPTPVDTPTPTAAPPPIACNHPSVTRNLFTQLEDVDGQFPMYGPETEPNFLCEAVYDIVHTPGSMAVHIKYKNVGANFGWWGIAIMDPNRYDASKHRQLCFWAYAKQPNQSFRVKMKDKTPAPENEAGDVATIAVANEWNQICTDISKFVDEGIEPDKMDNINLGFEQPSGSAEIWVADFEFK